MQDDIDDPRRAWLVRALAAGLFAAGVSGAQAQSFNIFGSRPRRLPEGQSIYGMSGRVMVNDAAATMDTRIRPGDTVETGQNSEVIFAVNTHAMILRADSRLVIEAGERPGVSDAIIAGLRMLTGKLLSVSRNAPLKLTSSTATIGIRGTGFYIESDPERTYFCTCYGATDIEATADPASRDSVVATRHDRPLYIVADGNPGENIRPAPFINHTDQELSLIETLVGRTVPFNFSSGTYTGPRRTY